MGSITGSAPLDKIGSAISSRLTHNLLEAKKRYELVAAYHFASFLSSSLEAVKVRGFFVVDREASELILSLGPDYAYLYLAIKNAVKYKDSYVSGIRLRKGQMLIAWRTIGETLYPSSIEPSVNTLRSRIAKLESMGLVKTAVIAQQGSVKPLGTVLTVVEFDEKSPDFDTLTVSDLMKSRELGSENIDTLSLDNTDTLNTQCFEVSNDVSSDSADTQVDTLADTLIDTLPDTPPDTPPDTYKKERSKETKKTNTQDGCLGKANGAKDGFALSSENPKKPKPKSFDPLKVEIPSELNTPEFIEAWGDWCAYRIEGKNPLTELAVKRQFRDFIAWGAEAAAKEIDRSIKAGWTGVFEPKSFTHRAPAKKDHIPESKPVPPHERVFVRSPKPV